MLEASVDSFSGAVAGSGSVEVGEHVRAAFLQGPAQGDYFGQWCRDVGADGVDEAAHQLSAWRAVGVAVGGDHLLVDPPGRFDLDVSVVGEQCLEVARDC